MPTFPRLGKPDQNLLEQFFEPSCPAKAEKKADRMARSQKARKHRDDLKEIEQHRNKRGVKGS